MHGPSLGLDAYSYGTKWILNIGHEARLLSTYWLGLKRPDASRLSWASSNSKVGYCVAKLRYDKLNVLVADDFSNFRATVNRMLMDLGVVNIDMASNCDEIIENCARQRYDVVLSDYNLGDGRNGQHVLEELRHKRYLDQRSIFILVSAESSRNIVMSAYDSSPDDYLMKPITTQMLHTRLERLLIFRLAFEGVFRALDAGDASSAMDLLIDMSIAENRYSTAAQKMLGEMFFEHGEYYKAEKLYMSVLEVRELDWARLGLARAKQKQGDLDQAGQWLERIIEDNYLYLPAYDVLSTNFIEKGDVVQAQSIVQRSVDVSPMSILRQKNLAQLAEKNNDLETVIDAKRKIIKLGKLSCYGGHNDEIGFIRAVSAAVEAERDVAPVLINEAEECLSRLNDILPEHNDIERCQLLYVSARLLATRGETHMAQESLVRAETSLIPEDSTIDVEIDHVRALQSLGFKQKMHDLLSRLQELYEYDQDALQRLDEFLDEPASDANKEMVAKVNHDGIELYNEGAYLEALNCFDRAMKLFPKHIGLQLNIVQTHIGLMKADPENSEAHEACRESLNKIAQTIEEDHSQYRRYSQLKAMARSFYVSIDPL